MRRVTSYCKSLDALFEDVHKEPVEGMSSVLSLAERDGLTKKRRFLRAVRAKLLTLGEPHNYLQLLAT